MVGGEEEAKGVEFTLNWCSHLVWGDVGLDHEAVLGW
jgi:hypothetical protein